MRQCVESSAPPLVYDALGKPVGSQSWIEPFIRKTKAGVSEESLMHIYVDEHLFTKEELAALRY
jgi:hypothetical protein